MDSSSYAVLTIQMKRLDHKLVCFLFVSQDRPLKSLTLAAGDVDNRYLPVIQHFLLHSEISPEVT